MELNDILYKNLSKPLSHTLIVSKSYVVSKFLFDNVAEDKLFDSCIFKPRDLQVKSVNESVVTFVTAASKEDCYRFCGMTFDNVILIDYPELGSEVKSFAISRLRSMNRRVSAYGSNSKDFEGFVKLKLFGASH